jgi:2-desacetyl-2-hydroxyethyl bacteriochlorophyllide A dehydrogenase
MKAVVYLGPGRIEVADIQDPQIIHPRDAIVRVTRTAICGSDLHAFRGELPTFDSGTVLGHEFTGEVVEAGPEVPFATGDPVLASDLVACGRCAVCARGWHYHCSQATLFGYSSVVGSPLPGGQAELVRVPFADVVLSSYPAVLTDEQVLFAGDILTTAVTATVEAGMAPGDTVAIIGAGPVGILSALCARASGASITIVADPDERRRVMASSLGFQSAEPSRLSQLMGDLGLEGVDRVVEAVGNDAALRCAIETVGAKGTVVAVGAHSSDTTIFPARRAFSRELTLRFAVGDPIKSRDRAIALVASGRVDPTSIVSHRLPLSESALGYQLFDQRLATKVVLTP